MTPPVAHDPQHLLRLLALAGMAVWRFDHAQQRLVSTPEALGWLNGAANTASGHVSLAEVHARLHPTDAAVLHRLLGTTHSADTDTEPSAGAEAATNVGAPPPATPLRFRVQGAHGQWLWLAGHSLVAERDGQGQPRVTLGVLGWWGAPGLGSDPSHHQAEAERAELLERLQNIAAQLPGAIYQYHRRVDGTAHFPYASAALLDIYGVTPESAQSDSSHITRRLHPDDRARINESMTHSAQTLTPWKQEYRVVLPEGGTRWVQGQSSPQRLADGSTLWHGYLQDITRERELRERLRLGASVFANSYDGVVVTNAENLIVEVNPAFSRITGYDATDVLGKNPRY